MIKMAHVAPYKKEIVAKLCKLIKEYPIIALVDVENLPAKQFQMMREKLRDSVVIIMTKKRLIKIAFEEMKSNKKGLEKMSEHFRGMPCLLLTKESPFKLYAILKKNKSPAPAKAGQIAPKEIIIPAGSTNFSPGPVIGELGALGVKTKVDAGKVAVIQNTTVCKEGATISAPLASMLQRLNILPMEVGLGITAVYDNETIFTRSVLDIDEDKYMTDFIDAASWAFNLAIEISYPTKETMDTLLSKAQREAMNVAIEGAIVSKDTINDLLAIAERSNNSIKSIVNL
jgi:large subunit ribosomal protein L10